MDDSSENPDYLLLAQPRLQSGDIPGALEMIDKAIAADPADHQAWNMKGLLLSTLGRDSEAAECLAKAEELDEGGIDTQLGAASQKSLQGDHAGAAAIYDELLAADHTLYEAWTALAICRLELGQKPGAVEAARKAVEKGQGEPQLHYTLGRCLRHTGHDEEAVEAFDQCLDGAPDHALSLYEKGMSLEQINQLEESLACFEHVVELMPDDANAQTAIQAIQQKISERDGNQAS